MDATEYLTVIDDLREHGPYMLTMPLLQEALAVADQRAVDRPSPEATRHVRLIQDALRELRQADQLVAARRSAEDIARSGDLDKCTVRELLDLAREMGIHVGTDWKPAVLRTVRAAARERGWLE